MDMIVVYSVYNDKDEKDLNVVRNLRGLLNILQAVLLNKSNIKILSNYSHDQKSIDTILIRKIKECEDEKVYD